MNIGDYVYTPRFLHVRISKIFPSLTAARDAGYTEPTHYVGTDAFIYGKSLDLYHMEFAAVVKPSDTEPPF